MPDGQGRVGDATLDASRRHDTSVWGLAMTGIEKVYFSPGEIPLLTGVAYLFKVEKQIVFPCPEDGVR